MNRALFKFVLGIGIFTLVSCSPSTAKPEAETVETSDIVTPTPSETLDDKAAEFGTLLNEYIGLNQRLENVAYRVLSSNAQSCPETRKSIGMKVHTIQDYPEALQAYAGAFFKLDGRPAIRVVAANSPAFLAGLKPGDQVLKLGEFALVSGENAGQFFEALQTKEFRSSSNNIEIKRGTEKQVLELRSETICGYPAQLFYSELVNAHTNGEEIWVTSELLRQVDSDTSLALIIAHELAHATRRHMDLKPTKALELEADRLSLIYLSHAGYSPADAVRLWQENPLNHEQDETGSHPSRTERLAVLNNTLLELEIKP